MKVVLIMKTNLLKAKLIDFLAKIADVFSIFMRFDAIITATATSHTRVLLSIIIIIDNRRVLRITYNIHT